MNSNQMPWYVALLKVTHSICDGTGSRRDGRGIYVGDYVPCEDCQGTGQVPLLDVREDCQCTLYEGIICIICPPYGNRFSDVHPEGKPCCNCHGLGWTPTKDAWKWIGSFVERFPELAETTPFVVAAHPDIFYPFLVGTLTPLAINAAEAEEWVRVNVPS